MKQRMKGQRNPDWQFRPMTPCNDGAKSGSGQRQWIFPGLRLPREAEVQPKLRRGPSRQRPQGPHAVVASTVPWPGRRLRGPRRRVSPKCHVAGVGVALINFDVVAFNFGVFTSSGR
eukprot:10175175-Heterocapsa_arctica.AAC.1